MSVTSIGNRIASLPPEFFEKNGIRRLRLFGSHLSGPATESSDVDLLVDFEPDRRVGYLSLARTQLELADQLGAPVDLRTAGELSYLFRSVVLDEAVVLYER